MVSKVYEKHRRFKENPLNTMKALDDLRLHGIKHLSKSILDDDVQSICRKRLQFWQREFCMATHQHNWQENSSPKLSLTRLHSSDLTPCDICLFPSMKKHLQGRRFVSSDEGKVASQESLQEVGKNGFQKLYERWQRSVLSLKGTTLKVDVLRCYSG
ncbi:hypothetical protein TNCV_4974491 [Trichonephila clavipes]|uniref:Uncharacterized protein n=1 Tax=Trichonephila clavipes TaxID=2585209 RepID=A0A8X6VLK5_TRICX|nr:hypothetical protein TNCV_4974491 [Trichonephila clavipes]